jgi:hypothetical protein
MARSAGAALFTAGLTARTALAATSKAAGSLAAHLSARTAGSATARGFTQAGVTLVAGMTSIRVMARATGTVATSLSGRSLVTFKSALSSFGRSFTLNPNLIALGASRVMTALGLARVRTALGISNTMARTNDLGPAIDASIEIETVTFDYGDILATGVTITLIVLHSAGLIQLRMCGS